MSGMQIRPAPRVDFGRVVHRPGKEGHYLFTHGMDGHDFSGAFHNRIDLRTAMQISHASMLAQVEPEIRDGPFSDSDGEVSSFGKIIFDSLSGPDEKVARLISILNDGRFFRFYPDMVSEDRPFTPGALIREPGRIAKDLESGDCARLFGHVMEAHFFAVALLRMEGLRAFPAFGVLHGMPRDEHNPLVAVVDPSSPVPLRTFSVLSTHPPMHHLAILEDRPSRGLSYVLLAENRMKSMMEKLAQDLAAKRAPPDDMLARMCDSISDSLLCSQMVWPNNLFIQHSIEVMGNHLFQKMATIAVTAGFEGNELKKMLESAARFSAGMMCRIEDAFETKKRMSSQGMH